MSNKLLLVGAGNDLHTRYNLTLVDYHLHTNYTDGNDSMIDMYRMACAKNLSAVLFSEHARASSISWFPSFVDEAKTLKSGDCNIFIGVEARINSYEGTLDSCEDILNLCDLVIGSVHRFPSEEYTLEKERFSPAEAVEIEYALSKAALDNPNVNILGHPFGMSLRRFNIVPEESYWISLLKLAAEKGIAIEINSKYHKHIIEKLITWCKQFGNTISPGSDAHNVNEVGSICPLIKEYL